MADGVFGTPIDIDTLKGMPEYRDKTIQRSDMAEVARDLMHAEGKDTNCQRYVDNLSNSYGTGVKTLCTIYNATGDDITYVLSHDWHGEVADRPYPMTIQNGQWGGFLHVHPTGMPIGSAGAVVYRGINAIGRPMNWLLSWSVPWSTLFGGSNRVLTEIREDGHYQEDNWNYIYNMLENASRTSTDFVYYCKSTTSIGTSNAPSYTAVLTIT
ncbi:hypothetical protein LguiA_021894 [Lonicera macranthoides]